MTLFHAYTEANEAIKSVPAFCFIFFFCPLYRHSFFAYSGGKLALTIDIIIKDKEKPYEILIEAKSRQSMLSDDLWKYRLLNEYYGNNSK